MESLKVKIFRYLDIENTGEKVEIANLVTFGYVGHIQENQRIIWFGNRFPATLFPQKTVAGKHKNFSA